MTLFLMVGVPVKGFEPLIMRKDRRTWCHSLMTSPFRPMHIWAELLIAWINKARGKSGAASIARPCKGACGDEFGFGAFG